MKKTNISPKTPGYYWYQNNMTDGEWIILEVSYANPPSKRDLYAENQEIGFGFRAGSKASKKDKEFWGDEPIPKPQE